MRENPFGKFTGVGGVGLTKGLCLVPYDFFDVFLSKFCFLKKTVFCFFSNLNLNTKFYFITPLQQATGGRSGTRCRERGQ
jgi:hypothetical protein